MATQISTLLTTHNLHSSLPTSLSQTLHALFLIECPTADPAVLRTITLNAAFLEYLSTQHISRIKSLLGEWERISLVAVMDGEREEKGGKDGSSGKKEGEGLNYFQILDGIEEFLVEEVENVCICFEGQDVEALKVLRGVKERVRGILEEAREGRGWRPRFICQLREV